jgi:hypothetical protein
MKKIVMLFSALAVLMSACVVVPVPVGDRGARGGDRDHDGVPNRVDRDRDGDGVPNRHDRRPNDPDRR